MWPGCPCCEYNRGDKSPVDRSPDRAYARNEAKKEILNELQDMNTSLTCAQDILPGDFIQWDGRWIPVLDVAPASVNNFVLLMLGPSTSIAKHRREPVEIRRAKEAV